MENLLLSQYNTNLANQGVAQLNSNLEHMYPPMDNNTQGQALGIQPLLPPGVTQNPLLPPGVDPNEFGDNKKQFGLNNIFNLYKSFSPTGIAFRTAKGLFKAMKGSDFGRSRNLFDYLDARKYGGIDARERARSQNMREARAVQKQLDLRTASGKYDDGQDRGMGQTNTRSRSSSPRQERQTSGAGGLHSGY